MKKNKLFVFLSILLMTLMLMASPFMVRFVIAAPETLKIGVVSWLGWPLGLDFVDGVKLLAEDVNKRGGLEVGKEKYQIEIIAVDSKMDHSTAKGAVERLVYQDKVKFILGDETVDAWLPITEENKILVCAVSPAPAILSPKYIYCYQGAAVTGQAATLWGWLSKNRPNIKTVVCAAPDQKNGHEEIEKAKKLADFFGIKVLEAIYYPPTQKDFSSIGTLIKNLNPDVFQPNVGGPPRDAGLMKAAYQAGYRGQFFCPHGLTAGHILHFTPPESVEGLLGGMNDVELEDPPPVAKEYKELYIAKHGKWTDPDVLFLTNWYLMMAGIQKAQSLDPEKIKTVMDKGLRFTSASGEVMTVTRPDQGNNRACDIVVSFNVKKIEGGKAKKIAYISVEESYETNKKFRGW
jgi:branched-chain amino acid transport system substrate-binding protein